MKSYQIGDTVIVRIPYGMDRAEFGPGWNRRMDPIPEGCEAEVIGIEERSGRILYQLKFLEHGIWWWDPLWMEDPNQCESVICESVISDQEFEAILI